MRPARLPDDSPLAAPAPSCSVTNVRFSPTRVRQRPCSRPRRRTDLRRCDRPRAGRTSLPREVPGDGDDDWLERLAAASSYGNESAGPDGGYAVPPDFRSAIMELVMGEDTLLGRCDIIPVSGNTFTCPADETTAWGTDGIQAYWDGESVAATQSKPSLQERSVKLNKVRALVPMTDERLRAIHTEVAPDFSGEICADAPLQDVAPAAIAEFRRRWSRREGNARIDSWSDDEVLRNAELTSMAWVDACAELERRIGGQVVNATLSGAQSAWVMCEP